MQNYNNYAPPYQNAGQIYQYNEIYQKQIIKQQERRSLRKASNGLGWMVIVYYLLMQVLGTIILTALYLTGVVTKDSETNLTFMMEIIVSVGAALTAGLFYMLISGRKPGSFLQKSNLTLSKLVPLVMLGMGAAMIANIMANLFDSNISFFSLENTLTQTTKTQTIPEIILYVISTALIPAFAEEFAFRGVFMSIMRKYGDAFAIITSSLLFGAMHGNTTQIIFAFVLGLIFAFIDCKANSIIPSIIIHFTNNFYAVVMDILESNSGLDKTTVTVITTIIILSFCLLGILSFIYLVKTDKNFFSVSNGDTNIYSDTDVLPFKEKIKTFITSPAIIVALAIFAAEMIYFLIPSNVSDSLLNG